MKSPQRTLVVDADIARAAGPDPKERPWSKTAQDAHGVLQAIWTCSGYRVAFDQTLRQEWKTHQGNTALGWFAKMLSARRIQVVQQSTDWVDDLIRSHVPEHDRQVALKDSHLVALAYDAGDDRLLSNDGKAREKFQRLSDTRITPIHWVAASSDSTQWLLDGAPDRPQWQLGHAGEPA